MTDTSQSVPVRSILQQLNPAVQDAIEHKFHKAESTTWVDKKTGEKRQCLYLTLVVPEVDGGVEEGAVARFSGLLAYLITEGLVAHAVLCDPIRLKLATPDWAFIWYVFSDFSREELNAKLGCECFVEEGGLYRGPWPSMV